MKKVTILILLVFLGAVTTAQAGSIFTGLLGGASSNKKSGNNGFLFGLAATNSAQKAVSNLPTVALGVATQQMNRVTGSLASGVLGSNGGALLGAATGQLNAVANVAGNGVIGGNPGSILGGVANGPASGILGHSSGSIFNTATGVVKKSVISHKSGSTTSTTINTGLFKKSN
ncbi:MAG: hypothetical protein ABSB18_05410 [Candidatus Omnitrophota bacterium]